MPLENYIQPIQAENIEIHENLVYKAIFGLQLEYIDRVIRKEIPPFVKMKGEPNFESLLLASTSFNTKCIRAYRRKFGVFDVEGYRLFEETIIKELSSIYEIHDPSWIKQIQDKIDEVEKESESFPEITDETSLYEHAGLIKYSLGSGAHNELDVFGIPKSANTISMHFDSLFKQKASQETSVKNTFSGSSFALLAKDIVDKYPTVQAITADSWILDTSIAKRIGFHVYDRETNQMSTALSFWGQFINENGQINMKRVDQFLKTGEPPYKLCHGYIPTIEFLKKYLPIDKRGKIMLKEVDPFYDKNLEKDMEGFDILMKNWDLLTKEKLDEFFNHTTLIKVFIKEYAPRFSDDIMECHGKGLSVEEMMKSEVIIVYKKLYTDFTENMKYIDKEYEI